MSKRIYKSWNEKINKKFNTRFKQAEERIHKHEDKNNWNDQFWGAERRKNKEKWTEPKTNICLLEVLEQVEGER